MELRVRCAQGTASEVILGARNHRFPPSEHCDLWSLSSIRPDRLTAVSSGPTGLGFRAHSSGALSPYPTSHGQRFPASLELRGPDHQFGNGDSSLRKTSWGVCLYLWGRTTCENAKGRKGSGRVAGTPPLEMPRRQISLGVNRIVQDLGSSAIHSITLRKSFILSSSAESKGLICVRGPQAESVRALLPKPLVQGSISTPHPPNGAVRSAASLALPQTSWVWISISEILRWFIHAEVWKALI